MIQIRKNKAEILKSENGVWISSKTTLKDMAVTFFKSLYSHEDINFDSYSLPNIFPRIDEDYLSMLNKELEDWEV